MIGWLGAMQVPARVVFAPIQARLGHRVMTAVIFLVQAVSPVQLATVLALPTFVPMVLMLGAANGMSTLARATAIAEIFGARNYGSISGANGAPALAPGLRGAAPGRPRRDERLFWALAGTLVVAGIGVLLIDSRR